MSEGTMGARVRARRKELGWTQDMLCSRAQISSSFLSEVENDLSRPRGPVLVRLAKTLEMSVDFLLTGEERVPPPARPLEIPDSLAEFASEAGIPFAHVTLLKEIAEGIQARRRALGPRQYTAADWREIYEGLRSRLEEK